MYGKKKSGCGGRSSRVLWRLPQYTFASVKIQASNQWCAILTAAGIGEQFLTGKPSPCPACGGRDRFFFDDKNGSGSFHCRKCGPGDGFTLLQKKLNLTPFEALSLVHKILGGGHHQEQNENQTEPPVSVSPQRDERRAAWLNKIWSESKPIEPGTIAHRYLTVTRGIGFSGSDALRFHPSLAYNEERDKKSVYIGSFPAIVAMVSNAEGKAVALHRIYLDQLGNKAKVAEPKKLTNGGITGGAIRLAEPTEQLGIAEGIETALSCAEKFGLPCWSVVSSSLMKTVVIPSKVLEVSVFADHDVDEFAGQAAAYALAERLLNEGKIVRVYVPPDPKTDWLDFFCAGGTV